MNDILSNLKDFVLQEEKDGLNIVEVVEHGCQSGVVSSPNLLHRYSCLL